VTAQEASESEMDVIPTVYATEQFETQVTTLTYAQGLSHNEWGGDVAEVMDLILDVYEPIETIPTQN